MYTLLFSNYPQIIQHVKLVVFSESYRVHHNRACMRCEIRLINNFLLGRQKREGGGKQNANNKEGGRSIQGRDSIVCLS